MKTIFDNLSPRASGNGSREELVLGVDGGGTKTRAIIMNGQHALGEGTAGPSNPLRVGIGSSKVAIREAIDKACAAASVQRSDIAAAQIGVAGVRGLGLRVRMKEALTSLGIANLEVVTDAEISLFGATMGEPGMVIIAGTGSICSGINGKGQRASAGGWGPIAGDEGSGLWIARRALQATAQAADGRGPNTSLIKAACVYFHTASVDELGAALYQPTLTNERLAGFSRHVIQAALNGDAVAHRILSEAGHELGLTAVAVIRKLQMERERFQVAYVGGIFVAGELVVKSAREEIARVAPEAFLAPPRLAPVVAAACMARERLASQIAIAV